MMALDGKTIKEEIPDKDAYDARKVKGNKEQCRTPDSPEGARVVTPRSPQQQRTSRNGCSSPVRNGSAGSITPPPPATPLSLTTTNTNNTTSNSNSSSSDASRLLKIRRFLGALVQFGQDTNADIGDRVRSLVLSLASGGLSIDDFQIAVQEATNFPLRTNVAPFLRSHIPLLQREITTLARANKQSPVQYVRANESSVLDIVHNPSEHAEIFLPNEGGSFTSVGSGSTNNGLSLKRRASDAIYDIPSNGGSHDWSDYSFLSKRSAHQSLLLGATPHLHPGHALIFDYQNGLQAHAESLHGGSQRGANDERDFRSSETRDSSRIARPAASAGAQGPGGDEDWRNIHSMLACISGMVEKTKRAISILQQRGVEPHPQETTVTDMRRQTEEKIAEFRRNAEDAVNQVKRQAVIEIQRAVASAENRALEMIAAERLKMEKMFIEFNRNNNEPDTDRQSPPQQTGHNDVILQACWNCGRKARETCAGCKLVRYCGIYCQQKDWEQHHKHICISLRQAESLQESSSAISRPPTAHSASLSNGLSSPPK
ncbi:protein CBFA2T3 [Culicoides brevitarsis]|uniref:protein CBFA2T3 n=1 Tax=Culicoides brevitarsis TaxID=469753 RepID=UPI00307C8870